MKLSEIGQSIKLHRKRAKLTQPQLAEKIGKTESSIRKYEKGLVQIPIDTVDKIAEAVGVTGFDLMGLEYHNKKFPNIGQEVTGLKALVDYLHSIGYISKCTLEDEDGKKISIELIKGDKTTTFTSEQFTIFEREIKESVEFKLWQKQKE